MIGEAGSWATVGGLLAVAMAVAATVAAGTVAVGPVRGLVLCLPGILGMAAGGATGWLWRAGPPRGPKDAQSCENRLWLAGGAAVLYAVGTAATVSLLRAGLMGRRSPHGCTRDGRTPPRYGP